MTPKQDENLKSMFAATPDCPDTDELAAMLEDEKRPGWAHLRHCSHCQGEMELMRSFLADQVTPEEQPHVNAIVRELRKNSPAKRAPWWKTLLTPWTLTPALAPAALAMVIFLNLGHQRPGDVVLNSADQVMRSQAIQIVAPSGDLPQAPALLAWKAAPNAVSYKVQVFEVDRTLLWTTDAAMTQVSVPVDLQAQIHPGKAMLWEVKALDGSGSIIADSGLTQFRVRVQ